MAPIGRKALRFSALAAENRLPGQFFGRQICETKWPADMDKMVKYWINTWTGSDREERAWSLQLADDLREEDPDLYLDPPEEVAGQLGANVLEDLLAKRGAAVIDRVETEARRNPKFHQLLSYMYTSSMTNEVRRRIEQLAPER